LKTVKLLIKNGAKVNVKDKGGFTPLHYSYKFNYKKIIKYLIAHGAKIKN
jgi:ankyrin repeat protein